MKSPSSSSYKEVYQVESEDITNGFTEDSMARNQTGGANNHIPEERVRSVAIESNNSPSYAESDVGTHSPSENRHSMISRGSIGSGTYTNNASQRASLSLSGDSHIGKTVKSMGIWSR